MFSKVREAVRPTTSQRNADTKDCVSLLCALSLRCFRRRRLSKVPESEEDGYKNRRIEHSAPDFNSNSTLVIMSLYPFFRPRPVSLVGEIMRDMARMERQFSPFVEHLENSSTSSEIVNDNQKFAVNLNVSQFKPEELKINLDGRKLTIQGDQEVNGEDGYSKKSFSRIILLPEDVDVAGVISNLTEDGKLSIEAPKKETIQGRSIPIQQQTIQHKPAE